MNYKKKQKFYKQVCNKIKNLILSKKKNLKQNFKNQLQKIKNWNNKIQNNLK